MRFRSTAKVLAECKLKYYRVSKWAGDPEKLQADLVTALHPCPSAPVHTMKPAPNAQRPLKIH